MTDLDEELMTKKGNWEQVEHMFGQSPVCTACGQAPRDVDGNLLPAYNAVGVDVDWGNHLFLCARCAEIVAELHGCSTAEETFRASKQLKLKDQQISELETKLAKQQELIDRVTAGAKARKELKNSGNNS
jgi:hypothetical protein